mgnify:CR=1 FL=1
MGLDLTYSEMLLQLVDKFEEELPVELTFEDTIEIGIDAWNLANRKGFLIDKDLFKQQLKQAKFKVVIEKMVNYKVEKFSDAEEMIIDYSIKENLLKVETQNQKDFFSGLVNEMINLDLDT